MSTPIPRRQTNLVELPAIGDRIRLTEDLEVQLRRIVREELRQFLLAQRRAAKYIDAVVIEQLGLTTS